MCDSDIGNFLDSIPLPPKSLFLLDLADKNRLGGKVLLLLNPVRKDLHY